MNNKGTAVETRCRFFAALVLAVSLGIVCSSVLPAQEARVPVLKPVPQVNRVGSLAAGGGALVSMQGHVPGWAHAANLNTDSVSAATPLRLTVNLRRSAAAQAAFEQLLEEQQRPGSALYHHWITPAEVGELYGPTTDDVAAVEAWAQGQGFAVESVAPSRVAVELAGSAETAAAALHTSFSLYRVGNAVRRAPDTEPMLPASLMPVIQSIHGLTDDEPVPGAHHATMAHGFSSSGQRQLGVQAGLQPAYTSTSGNHFVSPADFSLIYDLNAIPSSDTGAAIGSNPQHIAIIDRSDVVLSDISDFATVTGIGTYKLNTIWPVTDPGIVSADQVEATLDVERVVGTTPAAISDLVVVGSAQGGIYRAASYAVNTLVDPVLSISYISCEVTGGQATVNQWDSLWSTAAAAGISVFVASGDSGAAGQGSGSGCALDNTQAPAVQSLHTNAICSSQYATCVGGTEFADTAVPATYWGSSNSATKGSAISYIPEGAWNEPTKVASGVTSYVVLGTSGGASKYISKPIWQTGTGVPADGARDTPDISLSSSVHDGYYGCYNTNCQTGSFEYFWGTSAAAPSFAAITARLNTAAGTSQGNLNPLIYRLANSSAAGAIFHDVTVASSGVASCDVNVPSMCNNSTPAPTTLTGGLAGYLVTAGFDLATGWGSIDAANFIKAAIPVSTSVSLAVNATQIGTAQTVNLTASLSPASTSVAAASGTLQFLRDGTALGSPVAVANNMAAANGITFPAAGTYSLTAVYSGDAFYKAATSSAVAVNVTAQPPSFSLSPTAASLSFVSGAGTGNTDAITLQAANGYAGSVTLTCSIAGTAAAIPPSCAVSPASVTVAANGSVAATATITSSVLQTMRRVPGTGEPVVSQAAVWAALGFGLLPFAAARRRRRWASLAAIAMGVFLFNLSGCSKNSTPAPTRSSAGTYVVTISGTGTGTGALSASSASTMFNVKIQ